MIAKLAQSLVVVALAAGTVVADELPEPARAPLKDDATIAAELSSIVNDPAIADKDPKTRDLAQNLMTEGVKQLQAGAFDQALANFLEAYGKFPSPKILLNIASTLRDMGRPAEAANTYQRYLADPASGATRAAEVKQLLAELDATLSILTVRVVPRLAEISIDGGPWVVVGSTLITRVRPGIHLVRIRRDALVSDVSINGFPGEDKEVLAAIKNALPDPPTHDPVATPKPAPAVEETHQAWMESDYHFARTDDANPNARGYRPTAEAPPLPPRLLTPHDDAEPPDVSAGATDDASAAPIASGALAVVRIDGKGRGFAGGIGIAVARDRLEGEAMLLRSQVTGGYLGARYRLFTGLVRPYVAGGIPFFVFDNTDDSGMTSLHASIGIRAAAGIELFLNGHLSVQFDLGGEHFFFTSGTRYESNAFVPTIGVIGRL